MVPEGEDRVEGKGGKYLEGTNIWFRRENGKVGIYSVNNLYCSLPTAVKGCISELGQPTPCQALMMKTKATEYISADGRDHFHFQNICSKN